MRDIYLEPRWGNRDWIYPPAGNKWTNGIDDDRWWEKWGTMISEWWEKKGWPPTHFLERIFRLQCEDKEPRWGSVGLSDLKKKSWKDGKTRQSESVGQNTRRKLHRERIPKSICRSSLSIWQNIDQYMYDLNINWSIWPNCQL